MTANVISQQQDGGNGNPTPPATSANNQVKAALISKLADAAEIFDDAQAGQYIGGISARAIRDWRVRRGLPHLRITAKIVRIRKTDLDKWLASRRVATLKGVRS